MDTSSRSQPLVQAYGEPITSTSANRPVSKLRLMRERYRAVAEAIVRGALHVLDGGQLLPSPPSTWLTVLDTTTSDSAGAVSGATLRDVVPESSRIRRA